MKVSTPYGGLRWATVDLSGRRFVRRWSYRVGLGYGLHRSKHTTADGAAWTRRGAWRRVDRVAAEAVSP